MNLMIFIISFANHPFSLGNTVPQLDVVPSSVRVTHGIRTTFNITGRDPDENDALTYHTENDWNGLVTVDPATGTVTYLPDVTQSSILGFYVTDSRGGQSSLRVVPVMMCSGCSGHGNCDFTRYSRREGRSFNFQFAVCVCEPAWDGFDCERDRDGCLGDPCMQHQNCTDLTPDQQGSNEIGYDCSPCPSGFTLDTNSQECIDIDECADTAANECSTNCFNVEGSYECSCNAGYRLDGYGHTCWDIDECQDRSDNCEHICVNTEGSFTCRCDDGYTLDTSRSTCIQDPATQSICSDAGCTQGCRSAQAPAGNRVPECFCYSGYDLDRTDNRTCRDINECEDSENADSLSVCTQKCINFDGGFECYCHSGYQLSEDKRTCNPCPRSKYGPNCELNCRCSDRSQYCDPVGGCICESGWEGTYCQDDIDECLKDPHICGNDKICINTIGSYTCSCLEGYELDDSGHCTDIDECSTDSVLNTCGDLEQCVNVPGSFHCTCIAGYQRTNTTCTDVNECAAGNDDCQQICVNVLGSYNCDCHNGYRLNTDRTSCSEVSNACADVASLNCQHGCTLSDNNTAVCFCRAGYQLDRNLQTCHDINECAAGTPGCSHACDNTDGGFLCSCPLGMKLDNDGRTCIVCLSGTYGRNCSELCACSSGSTHCDATRGCVCMAGWQGERCDDDINECDTESVQQECRGRNALCTNEPGGYRCQCEDGYRESNGICEDIDECLASVCKGKCVNFPGGYSCQCNKGFTLDRTTGDCTDINECSVTATNMCTQRCLNVPGSYICVCDKPGYELASDGFTCTATTETCNRRDCPTRNGGCSAEECFCDAGYSLADDNTCRLIPTMWCETDVCDQECTETADGKSFTCHCREGYTQREDGTTCGECTTGRYGTGCQGVCTCNMDNTVSCDTVNGTCTCKAGWEGPICRYDIDECAATPGVTCPDNSRCVNTQGGYICQCETGYYKTSSGTCRRCSINFYGENCALPCNCTGSSGMCDSQTGACVCREGWEGAHCDADVDECLTGRHDCSRRNARCVNNVGSFKCVCADGTVMGSAGCVELKRVRVVITVTGIVVPENDLTDVNSSTHSFWRQSAVQALTTVLQDRVSGFKEILILSLRAGSLIVESEVVVDDSTYPNSFRDLSVALLTMANDSLTVGGQTGRMGILLNNVQIQSSMTPCEVYEAIQPCPEHHECYVDEQMPNCRPVKTENGDKDNSLIIALGIAIPLLVIIIIVVCAVCIYKRKRNCKNSSDMHNAATGEHDPRVQTVPTTPTDGGFDNPTLNLPPVGDGEYYNLTDYDKTHPYAKLAPKFTVKKEESK